MAAKPADALQIVMGPPVVADKTSTTGQYALSGTVVDALTGAPIQRALVQLMGTQSQAVLTDEGGKFRFENLAQGQVIVNAHKPGYSDPRAISSSRFTIDTPIVIGRDAAPLVLKLNPDSAIVVKVTGEDGEGVESLPVSLLASQVQQGRRHWSTWGGQTKASTGLPIWFPGNTLCRWGQALAQWVAWGAELKRAMQAIRGCSIRTLPNWKARRWLR